MATPCKECAAAVQGAEARGRLDPRGTAAGYAYSAGYEDALRGVAEIVANYGDDLDDFYDRIEALVAHLWPLSQADVDALSPAADTTPPALVHGGPPRDSLDDGR